jgi:hypothetical protein
MPTQGKNASAGTADVAEQQLQDGSGPNDLYALGMLCPADRVTDGGGFLRTRGGRKSVGGLQEDFTGDAARAFDHLGRVA